MSLSVARSDGVMVLTLTSDTSSACPPLCQLLGALCYSPRLCSVSRHLPPQRGGAQAVLGALWIITGVLHIGLNTLLYNTWQAPPFILMTYCPVWLGVVFMVLGVGCVLSERFPRAVLVVLNGLLNLVGVALSIAGIVWYTTTFFYPGFNLYCPRDGDNGYYWYRARTMTMASPERSALRQRCEDGAYMVFVLANGTRAVLLTLAVLDLCLGLSAAILSFKSLSRGTSEKQPLLQEAKATTQGEGEGEEE